MKINKFIALAAIAIMAIGVMGFISTRARAQSPAQPAPQAQATEAPDNEKAVGADTDTLEEQVGDQNATDSSADSTSDPAGAKESNSLNAAPSGTSGIPSGAALKVALVYTKTHTVGHVQNVPATSVSQPAEPINSNVQNTVLSSAVAIPTKVTVKAASETGTVSPDTDTIEEQVGEQVEEQVGDQNATDSSADSAVDQTDGG